MTAKTGHTARSCGMNSTEIPLFSTHFPRFFTYFPRFSVKIPYICIGLTKYYILRYGKKRVYELGEAHNTSPNNSYLPRIGNIISRMSCDIRRAIAPISMEINPTIKLHKVILLFILLSCSFSDFLDLLAFTASVSL